VKTCTRCGVGKPLSAFAARRKSRGTLQSWCRDCHRAHAAERYARMTTEQRAEKRRRARERALRLRRLLWDRLSGAACVDCGESDILVLDFDHIGDKLGNIADLAVRHSWARVESEISACEIRCANCHRRRTAQRRVTADNETVGSTRSHPSGRSRRARPDGEQVVEPMGSLRLRCARCGLMKPVECFARHSRMPNSRQSWCRDCHNSHKRAFYAANRESETRRVARRRDAIAAVNAERIRRLLETRPCVDCGESDPIVLEFDHLRDKKAAVMTMAWGGLNWDSIEREIAKCEVRCVNCHRRRTAVQQGYRDRRWDWPKGRRSTASLEGLEPPASTSVAWRSIH
jgi:hypothetical protein